jgi:hypothetical protein
MVSLGINKLLVTFKSFHIFEWHVALSFPVVTFYASLGNTQQKAQELFSGPCLGAKARFLSFDRTQSRAVKTVHFVAGVEQRMKPRPIFFVSVKPWLHSDVYLGSFILEPEYKAGGHLEL